MGATGYLARLRECVGHDPLLALAAAACIRHEEVRILPRGATPLGVWTACVVAVLTGSSDLERRARS